MAISLTLANGGTTSTLPDPNTLSTVAPYSATTAARQSTPLRVSSAWATQGTPCLIPIKLNKDLGVRVPFHVICSNSSATWTIKFWYFNPISQTWTQPAADSPSVSNPVGGGSASHTFTYYGNDAIYLEIDALSAGTMSIHVDGSAVRIGAVN